MSQAEESPAVDRSVRWTVPDVVLAVVVGTVLGILLATATGAGFLRESGASDSVLFLVVGALIYGGIALMTWLLVLKRRSVPVATTGLEKTGAGPILLMIPLTIAVLFTNFVVSAITASMFGSIPTAEDQLALGPSTLTVVDLICLLVVGAVLAPVVEEFVFRGLLYRAIRSRSGVVAASMITAIAFSLVHFTPLLIGVLFVFGLILAAVVERYKSLYPAIVLHALNNAVVIGLVYRAQ